VGGSKSTIAIKGYEKAEQTSILDVINNVANICKDQGKLAEVEYLLQWALWEMAKVVGVEWMSTLDTVNN
jgi:hypothetical protein